MVIANVLEKIVGILWGTPLLVALVSIGLFLTIKSGFWQFRYFKHAWKYTYSILKNNKSDDKDQSGILSSYQAIATALGSAVGIGNIAGVASAIALGGPGALFWMWVCALIGMVTKMAEITLALHYRTNDPNKEAYGGPTYYIEKGFKEKGYFGWKPLAFLFGIGIMSDYFLGMSAYTISEAVSVTFNINQIVVGIGFAILLYAVILGGIQRLGRVLSLVVPFMALFYILAGLLIILKDISSLPGTFALIFKSAFVPMAPVGGFAGASISLALRTGIARGVYSNEAGWGTAAMIHSTAKVDHPVKQGLLGIVEVFIDTMIVCSITGLVIINTGVWSSGLSSSALALKAFEKGLGTWGSIILTLGIFLLGWTSVTAKYTNYEIILRHVFGLNKKVRTTVIKIMRYGVPLPGLFLTIYAVKNGIPSSIVWLFADMVTGIPTFVNIIALFLLSGKFFELLKNYTQKYILKTSDNKENTKLFYNE
ncbi:alanine/glycine:cation symporter family protein [Maledivibacter halophilus]|uniref:Alanine or glycine:cation symporter, AGCS family n=1 Tax=Maledivibacter halophilus TaxID=36842 RepID=A0A1T5M4L3_9FIRM|nr:sodium:alanine symporter family protein [Maledivibacter halophilus]SKC83181.1 alanine or glycine:cation symporter, AGCS family [Maledivibacter halophilus]